MSPNPEMEGIVLRAPKAVFCRDGGGWPDIDFPISLGTPSHTRSLGKCPENTLSLRHDHLTAFETANIEEILGEYQDHSCS